MKRLLAGALVFLFLACGQKTEEKNLLSYLPQETAVLIKSPELQKFLDSAYEFPFLTSNEFSFVKESREKLSFLNYADSLPNALLAFSYPEKGSFTVTFLSETAPEIKLDSVSNKSVEKLKINELEFLKYAIEKTTFYSTRTGNNIFLASNSLDNLKNLLEKEKASPDADFEKALKATDEQKNSVLIHHYRAGKIFEQWFPHLKDRISGFGSWSSLDLEENNGTLTVNGLSLWPKKPGLPQIFAETGASINQLQEVVPATASALFTFSFGDFGKFQANLKAQNADALSEKPGLELLQNASEAGVIYSDNKKILVLNLRDVSLTEEILSPYSSSAGAFRQVEIFTFEKENLFKTNLQPLLSVEKTGFYTFLGNFAVFAESPEQLENVITIYENKQSLSAQNYFKQAQNHLSGASNLLFIGMTGNMEKLLMENIAPAYQKEVNKIEFTNYELAALQVTSEKGYSHLHGVFLKSEAAETRKPPEQLLSVKLEAPLLTNPQLVNNHLNNEMDIVVQDINNKLYLISNTGEIFWKKQLNGPVLGKIKQVDLLKNGRFQLAFVTPNRVEVLDRNGKEVKPFPLKFRDEITQPLSLFDYDNNRNYRFLVSQGRELYMYDSKGKRVRGFGFSKAGSEVKFPPKHIRMGNKDYILIAESSGKLNILNRQGKERVKLDETFEFSENEWFDHEGNFVSSDLTGAIISIDENGHIMRKNKNLAENHKIKATSNLLVSLSENVLNIREKEVNLDYGLYTAPEIFLVNNVYYIATTDLQARKVYIFNSQAEFLPGFPVYGTSSIDINNADVEANTEFTVKGEEDEVLLYRF